MRPSIGLATLPLPSAVVVCICGPLHLQPPWAFMTCNGNIFTFTINKLLNIVFEHSVYPTVSNYFTQCRKGRLEMEKERKKVLQLKFCVFQLKLT